MGVQSRVVRSRAAERYLLPCPAAAESAMSPSRDLAGAASRKAALPTAYRNVPMSQSTVFAPSAFHSPIWTHIAVNGEHQGTMTVTAHSPLPKRPPTCTHSGVQWQTARCACPNIDGHKIIIIIVLISTSYHLPLILVRALSFHSPSFRSQLRAAHISRKHAAGSAAKLTRNERSVRPPLVPISAGDLRLLRRLPSRTRTAHSDTLGANLPMHGGGSSAHRTLSPVRACR